MALISNGTTIFDAGSMSAGFGGSMVFIKKLTASASGTLTFHHGVSSVILDSTYKEYVFIFTNIHPATDGQHLQFQGNVAGASGFNENMSAIHWRTVNNEAGGDNYVHVHNDPGSFVQSNETAFQPIATYLGADTDQSTHGFLYLFNPSNTTFVTQFHSRFSISNSNNYIQDNHVSGHFHVAAAIDEIQFKMTSGNIDSGQICLYGIA
tara:strand:- start:237 stop:860 length:624 start_codon:yes stop_codon:yes gene_type:complete